MSAFDVRDPASLRDVLDQINLPVYTIAGVARISPSELGRIVRGTKVPSDVQVRKLEPALAALLGTGRPDAPGATDAVSAAREPILDDEAPGHHPERHVTTPAGQGRRATP